MRTPIPPPPLQFMRHATTRQCFLHCWEFDLRTGACGVGKGWDVATYPVRIVDGTSRSAPERQARRRSRKARENTAGAVDAERRRSW
ncbi:MAG: hypothetical protein IPK26_10745 [Planctomycetes bacterium]|nr:hypothetical protein [Planctomycetota bacterium]